MRSAVSVSLPRDLLDRLDAAAAGRSRSEIVREALVAWLAKAGAVPRLGTLSEGTSGLDDLVEPTGEPWEVDP